MGGCGRQEGERDDGRVRDDGWVRKGCAEVTARVVAEGDHKGRPYDGLSVGQREFGRGRLVGWGRAGLKSARTVQVIGYGSMYTTASPVITSVPDWFMH